jgi:hypothetical protein
MKGAARSTGGPGWNVGGDPGGGEATCVAKLKKEN